MSDIEEGEEGRSIFIWSRENNGMFDVPYGATHSGPFPGRRSANKTGKVDGSETSTNPEGIQVSRESVQISVSGRQWTREPEEKEQEKQVKLSTIRKRNGKRNRQGSFGEGELDFGRPKPGSSLQSAACQPLSTELSVDCAPLPPIALDCP